MMMVVAVMMVICFTIVSAAYKYEICVSNKLELSNCVKVHRTFYQCWSLSQAFQLLETCCDSTDIVIEPGNYSVNASITVHDLTNIRIRPYSQSERTVIHCSPNVINSHDFDTGLAFIRVTDLILENLNFLGCGLKHVSTIQLGSDTEDKQFITLRSALFIQNSSNINLFNAVISESNGIGLLIFDTVGTVSITSSLFSENKLNSLEETKYFSGGGGIYIEFTNCTPGVAACDPSSNVHNSLSYYIIANCGFSGNNAIYNFSDSEPDRLASNVHVSFGAGGGLSVQFHGYAQNNTFRIMSCIFTLNKANSGGGVSVHCSPHLKEHAYKQIVLPSIEYCSSIWDPHQQSLIHKLEMIQHRAARFVLNRPWRRNHRDSITEMLVELKWPTLEDCRKQVRLMLLFKFVNKLIYVPNQYLPVLSPATSTRANHPLKLLQLYARTSGGGSS